MSGRIDVLYNNASAPRHAPVESFPLEDWHFTIDSELNSVFYVTRKAWPYLKESRGVVINIASTAGIRGSTPGGLAHAAAKAGVIGMTRHLALEGAPHGIRVLSISPGGIATPAIEEYGRAHPEDLEAAVAKNLIPRLGKPSEVVAMALFLASDDAAYMTGENVVIDGGRTTCTHWWVARPIPAGLSRTRGPGNRPHRPTASMPTIACRQRSWAGGRALCRGARPPFAASVCGAMARSSRHRLWDGRARLGPWLDANPQSDSTLYEQHLNA